MNELTNEYYVTNGLSNSQMSMLNPEQGGTPAKFKAYVMEKLGEKEETPSLQNGKLIHKYVEDPNSFIVSDIEKPSDMMSEWVEAVYNSIPLDLADVDSKNEALMSIASSLKGNAYKSTKDEGKIWLKFQEGFEYLRYLINTEDKYVLTSKQKQILDGVKQSLFNNSFAYKLLFTDAQSELPLYWSKTINFNGTDVEIKLKGLVDKLIIDEENKKVVLVDLKTTSYSVSQYQETFIKYRTYRQLAHYLDGIMSTYPHLIDYSVEVYIVVVETYGIHECVVFNVPIKWIQHGQQEIINILNIYAYHDSNNQWSMTPSELANGFLTLNYPDESREI